jgi:hypothetical protein
VQLLAVVPLLLVALGHIGSRIYYEIAAAAIYWLSDEAGPISGQVVDLELHPFIGINPPIDTTTIPSS